MECSSDSHVMEYQAVMKAAVLRELNTPLSVEEVDLDGPKAGEIRIDIAGAGVCHSDYHVVIGRNPPDALPAILGHEGAGVVTEVGPAVTGFAPGDHIVFSLTAQCGRCRSCTVGRVNLCENAWGSPHMRDGTNRFSQNGVPIVHRYAAFSEATTIPAEFAVKIRKEIPLDRAAILGCAVTTGVGAVVNRADVEAGSTVAIFGCGGVGLNVVQGAVLAAASRIVAVDTVARKLEIALSLGATHSIDASKMDPVARVQEITGGGADYAFEVIGSPPVIRQAFESLRPGGTAIAVGVPAKDAEITVPAGMLFMDRGLLGSFYGSARPRVDFHWLIDLYLDGRLKLDELITRYRPLEEINEAFDDMNSGGVARTVLIPR